MNIVQVVIIAIVATVLIAVLKPHRPEIAILLGIAAGLIILSFVTLYLQDVIKVIQKISAKINLEPSFIQIVFKIVAVAYLCEFGAQICKDAGETGISTKVELAGKVLIVCMASPIILALLELIGTMI